jgi:hypothetical protein
MTQAEAIEVAEKAAAGRCDVTIHHGDGRRNIAVRLSRLDTRDAAEIGRDIAYSLCGDYREGYGFFAVWYDPHLKLCDLADRRAEIDEDDAGFLEEKYA